MKIPDTTLGIAYFRRLSDEFMTELTDIYRQMMSDIMEILEKAENEKWTIEQTINEIDGLLG